MSAQEMEDANLPVARRERRESSHSMRYGVETSAQNRPTSRARKLCRVPNCPHADLTDAPRYCIRHSICEVHIKAMEVRSLNLAGLRTRVASARYWNGEMEEAERGSGCSPLDPQVMFNNKPYRFCQKCTRFHERHEFEADRHTCRERLQEQREKRMANMLARRSKLAAVDDRADNPQAHSAYPMLELPSIGYAVGSKRAAPQISDSLLMQLTFESQLPSSAGAGFGMTEVRLSSSTPQHSHNARYRMVRCTMHTHPPCTAGSQLRITGSKTQFTSGGKLGMPSDMVMNTASEVRHGPQIPSQAPLRAGMEENN
jgi:hypothetical protein